MRVLQLCPLWFPIGQDAPGGIETFLAQLVARLADCDCEVTVIASGDSTAEARLLPAVERNIYDQMQKNTIQEYTYYEQHQLHLALQHADGYDVIHSHIGPSGFVLSHVAGMGERVLHTIHGPVYQDLQWYVRQHPHACCSTVSEFQAKKLRLSGARNCHVIHNGIDARAFMLSQVAGDGLLFLGRMEREKGPDIAIDVAKELKRPLVLAGPIVQQGFFDHSIAPCLGKDIEYIGCVDHRKKNDLLGSVGCVLMPSRWDEPFGMVAVEAMACGTPVVATCRGALPEIIESGATGYLARDAGEMAGLVMQALKLDRAAIRARAVARFDIPSVAKRYHRLYTQIATGSLARS